MLSADISYNSNFAECYIRNYNGKFSEETNSVSSIWEVEVDSFDNRK